MFVQKCQVSNKTANKIWNLCQTFDKEFSNNIPAWGAFNSLLNPVPEISICQSLSLYPSPLTDWATLHAALKIVQGINIAVTEKNKTIVSFDLQLHSKCMLMIENPDICNNYIFRLGELHIVFAMIKILGKYIENSGLDRLFIETGIYGETTLGQIKRQTCEAMSRSSHIHVSFTF